MLRPFVSVLQPELELFSISRFDSEMGSERSSHTVYKPRNVSPEVNTRINCTDTKYSMPASMNSH